MFLFFPIRYVCLWQKGYQETEAVISSVTTKVKGYTASNTSALGLHVWDVTEYVIPPQVCLPSRVCYSSTGMSPEPSMLVPHRCGSMPRLALLFTASLLEKRSFFVFIHCFCCKGDDSFFVLTNMITTPGQTQQACPEVQYV